MSFMPFQILGVWVRALLSLAILGLGIYLVKEWTDRRQEPAARDAATAYERSGDGGRAAAGQGGMGGDDTSPVGSSDSSLGLNLATALLAGGAALILWSLAGGWFWAVLPRRRDPNPPKEKSGGKIERLHCPDGSELHVECFGPPDGVPLILTHGWGLDHHEWTYAKKELASHCRVIVWDLPGLGRSKGPANKDWSLEKLAQDLAAVVEFAGNRPVILAGHSIGGMIILTYCRIFPQALGRRVAGLVLAQTTYTNPVETTSMARLYRALQKPVLEPLCHLMIWLAPLVWLMNWYSYLTGSAHWSNHRSFFSGKETREQLGFIARYVVQSWPGVLARGMLGMFRFDATPTLATISVPALVVDGDRDTTCTPEASDRMSQSIPGARRATLRSARHGGVFEFHERFAAAIKELLPTSRTEPADPIPVGGAGLLKDG